ncbi:VOC family protein [Microbacterium sp. NE2HP2]|uniref:VOC family protein n=1 Tax=Microbacterium TaxID=33882 RepID=UPI002365D4EC|nr:VOC family protein [Microbacterium plantarum]MDD7945331.1 VOC family protein [Microbacterium plantarum]
MELKAATVGIPVRDLDAATSWYRSALSLKAVDLALLEGLVEFNLGPIWLQLALDPDHAGVEGISLNLSVPDASAERARFAGLGLDVSEVQRFEGVVEFFTLTDPDGNKLGFVTELA